MLPWPTAANFKRRTSEDPIRKALSNGRIIASVGSDVSITYGRVSWGGMLRGEPWCGTCRTGPER